MSYQNQLNINSANKRIARNSIYMSLRMIIVLGITLYTTREILSVLGVEDYGIYNVVCGFVSMFAFLNTSMSNGIQRFFNYELGKNGEEGANKVYNTALLTQLILAIIIIVLTESFGLWFLHNIMVVPADRMVAAEWIFQFSVISFLFIIMQAPYIAVVMAHERMDFYAVMSVFDVILKLAIVFLIPSFSIDQLIIYGLLLCLISVLDLVLYYLYSKHCFSEIRFKKGFEKNLFRAMLSFSGWNLFGAFSGIMKEQGINIVINLFCGPIVNAARGVAAQVNSGLQNFVTNVTVPVRPQVMKSYASGDIDRTLNLTYSVSKLSCMFLYVLALPILSEIDIILKVWLGDNIPEYTSSFVVIVVMTSFINNLNGAVSGVVHASGKMKNYQVLTSIIGLLAVPLAYLGFKLGASPEMALWAVFITMVIVQLIALLVLKTIISFSVIDYVKNVILPLLSVICFTIWIPFAIRLCIENDVYRLCATICICMTSSAFISYFFGLNKSEKSLVNNMICKIAKNINRQ